MGQVARSLTIEDALATLARLPEILSAEEAAGAVGISVPTLRRRIQEGRLRALKTSAGRGGRLRILKKDLAQFLSEMGR